MNDYKPRKGMGVLSNTPPVVKNLILVNVLMYLATLLFPDFMYEHFSLFYFESPFFKPYQFVTHMFMHAQSPMHILFNMYALWMFGRNLEMVWGGKRFFIYYFVTGLGAAALHMFVLWLQAGHLQGLIDVGSMSAISQYNDLLTTPTVGASGAVFGVLLGFGMLFPNAKLQLLFPPITLTAKWFVIIYGAIELVLGFTNSGGSIAHFAHIGGMLFGYLLIKLWDKSNKPRGPYQR